MIEIINKNDSKKLYQWDLKREIVISADANVVDFAHKNDAEAVRVKTVNKDGVLTASIPNALLQSSQPIVVWLVKGDQTVHGQVLPVIPRQKPADYVATEDDVLSYVALEQRVAELEKNAGAGGIVMETDPTVPNWAKQPEKPTYTAAEVGAMPKDAKIPSKASDLDNDSGFLTEHQDLSGYAKQSSVDTVLKEAKEYTDEKINEIPKGEVIDVDAELKEYIVVVKPKIKQAIINKGGNVANTDSFGDYATRITEIPNGIFAAEDLPNQTILTATYESTSPNGIKLSFKNVDADGYLIIKKKNEKPESSADGEIVYNGEFTELVTDSDVTLGETYYYRIYPRNAKNQYQSLEGQSVAVCEYKSRATQKQAKDLALDESVALGYYSGQIFTWSVVDTQSSVGPIFAANQNCGNKQFDAPENATDNPNPITEKKNSGNNRWAFSNTRQWLNSAGKKGAWYEKQHDYDVAPSYKTEAGFLNSFTETEIAALVSRTNICILDANDGGGTETVEDLIWLPSSYEIGKEITVEGYKFEKYDGTNESTAYQSNWWLRTVNNAVGTANTACGIRYVLIAGSQTSSSVANNNVAVRPFCQLRGDTWLTWSDDLEAYVLADDSQRTWEA